MAILARYLFRQYIPAFLLCVGICTGVLLMNQFLRLFNLAVMKGISFTWILSCFARLLPYFLSMAIPIAFLVALLLTLGQLSETGEIMALRSSGFSFPEILWPYFSLALVLSSFLFYLNHKASPEGYHSFKNAYETAIAQVSRLDLEPDTFADLGDWKLYMKQADKDTGRMGGVYLVKTRGGQQGLRIDAPEGRVRLKPGEGFEMELYRGTLHWPDAQPAQLLSAAFEVYRLFIPLGISRSLIRDLDIQELNTFRLRDRLREPDLESGHRNEYTTEMALRSAAAATPVVFFWVGCPLGLVLEKHAKATGFAMSLLVLFFYYGLLAAGIGLGRRHLGLAPFGPWIPVGTGLCAGAYFWVRNLRR